MVRLQGGDGSSRYAWGQICDVSRREFEKVYGRLDVKVRMTHTYAPHARAHARTRARVHACTRTHAHAHMHMHTYPHARLDVQLTEVGESFYNEYIPPVLDHLQQIGAAPG